MAGMECPTIETRSRSPQNITLYRSSPELFDFFQKHSVDRNRAQSVAFYASRLEVFTVYQLHLAICKNELFLEDLGMSVRYALAIKLTLRKLSVIYAYNS